MSDEIQELGSRIDRIEVTLSHAVDAIDKIASIVNRPQEIRWAPILTAIALLLAAGGGYTHLVLSPVERDTVHLREEVGEIMQRELERERTIGYLMGRSESDSG